ncbi:MAG TPA: WXG100 family type VII secretion target [Candidatus Limnocylindrales bacterium]
MTDKPILAQYAQMDTAVASMKQISQVIDSKLDVLRKELTEVKWVGGSQKAWERHQIDWDAAVNELNQLLQLIAVRVGKARDNYLTTENEVARDWGNAGLP